MTIRQLFRKVFQETLTEQGFKYKNNYFYRLNGEMIQGVTVHIATGGGGYSIRLACYPYWMHNAINVSDRIRNLKKPYWVEQCEPSVGVICAHLDDETESVRLMKGELDYFADDYKYDKEQQAVGANCSIIFDKENNYNQILKT